VLGADDTTIRRARRRAEDLKEWKRDSQPQRPRPASSPGTRDEPGQDTLADELARAIVRYATVDGRGEILTARQPASLPIRYQLTSPDVTLSIQAGDLFEQDTHLAVGFSDTFDTSVADDRVIHSSSVQGQLLCRLYGGDQQRLDEQLAEALAGTAPARIESRRDKPHGKLVRYPLGTVAVLGEPRQLIFAVAYGRMGNDLVVRAPVEDLWHCYAKLWESVYRHGQRGALSVPLMGSGLARIDTLDRGNLLRLILLSFVAYSRGTLICHELRIIIHPGDAGRIDLASLSDFLRTL
jgi:hypothetical protein